jgi:hypothetical protein
MAATDRSMPPVSITSVCPAARMPSGAANMSAFDVQVALTVPGRDNSIPATKTTSSRISTMIVCRRSRPRMARADRALVTLRVSARPVICGSA